MTYERIKHIALQVVDPSHGAWVAQVFGVALAAASSFVMPVKAYLYLIGALVLCDMFTGWRAAKKARGERFSSKGMSGTIEKTALYMLAVLICRGSDIAFNLDGQFGVTYVVSGLIVGRELLSNLENIGKITGLDLAERVRSAFSHIFGSGKKEEQQP